MKALTLTQPWASLVAIGAKRIETRSWSTSYRGPLAIHAAKGFPNDARRLCMQEPFRYALFADLPSDGPFRDKVNDLPLGEIVAVCRLTAVHRVICTPSIPPQLKMFAFDDTLSAPRSTKQVMLPPDKPERSFGDYSPGRFAWILADVRRLKHTVPAKGMLGLWEMPLELMEDL
jgi:hypothetical protein